ncbi:MAG TPA: hypothetical protein VJO34_02835, partial [Methylomirabilota bacterium]|nr:hypothetical protein [Methylomirabilota bacterium]
AQRLYARRLKPSPCDAQLGDGPPAERSEHPAEYRQQQRAPAAVVGQRHKSFPLHGRQREIRRRISRLNWSAQLDGHD